MRVVCVLGVFQIFSGPAKRLVRPALRPIIVFPRPLALRLLLLRLQSSVLFDGGDLQPKLLYLQLFILNLRVQISHIQIKQQCLRRHPVSHIDVDGADAQAGERRHRILPPLTDDPVRRHRMIQRRPSRRLHAHLRQPGRIDHPGNQRAQHHKRQKDAKSSQNLLLPVPKFHLNLLL